MSRCGAVWAPPFGLHRTAPQGSVTSATTSLHGAWEMEAGKEHGGLAGARFLRWAGVGNKAGNTSGTLGGPARCQRHRADPGSV